jgi:alcohol dehydrogenase class IV
MSFVFQTTRSILYELGAASTKTGTLLKNLGCKSIMLVTDRGIVKAGLLSPVISSVERAGLRCQVFDRVVADPPASLVQEAVHEAWLGQVDGVLGLGGGSPMDVAKLVAFLNGGTSQKLDEIYGVNKCEGRSLPLVQIPTTAGTGSEVTPISIITTGENEKKGVVSPALYPDWAIIDGELTLSLPKHVTAATGIDAMVHAIEAYTSKLRKNPMSDLLAREALKLLGANIRRVCTNGNDAEARGCMLLGSMYAGMAFANSPVGGVHALAYPIGSHFHVPHGLSNSLMLPHVLRFNGSHSLTNGMYQDLARIAFPSEAKGDSHVFAQSFSRLALDLGIATRLQEVGIRESDVKLLATEAMKQTRLLPNNPVEVTWQHAHDLYAAAL